MKEMFVTIVCVRIKQILHVRMIAVLPVLLHARESSYIGYIKAI